MPTLNSATRNHLLAALPSADLDRLFPQLELVSMPLGEILYESSVPLEYVYFPTTSIVSLFYALEDGASAEIAVVGNEGALGISQLIVDEIKPSRAVVQRAGYGYRLQVRLLQYEFNRAGPVLRLLLHYARALSTQMKQTAACHRHHSVEQQLCRWLLLNTDRLSSNALGVTRDLVTNIFGGRHDAVMEATRKLEGAGLICYRDRRIEVLDRAGLEQVACECYAVIKTECDRLFADMSCGDLRHTTGPSET
jgi:CRP-like cAMP-binding protein